MTTFTKRTFGGVGETWAEADYQWADAEGSWGAVETGFTKRSKNTTAFTNRSKS